MILEAQQRYFSYRAMFVAIVSQNSFVLVLMGYRTSITRYVAEWGIAQMCLCKTKYQGRGIAPFQGSADFPYKVSRDSSWGDLGSKLGQIQVEIGSKRGSKSGRGEWGLGVGVIKPEWLCSSSKSWDFMHTHCMQATLQA